MTDPDGQVTRYDYDAANRPTFTTDPELRRTLKVYNAASEVIEERRAVGTPIEQAYVRYTYTLNGKQASVQDARGNQTSYSYDGFDRPLRTTFPNATFEQLTYDVLDRVTAKLTRANQTISNTYDVLDRLVTHIVPQPGTTAAIVTSYTYDLAGRTLTMSDTTGQGLSYRFDAAKRVISASQTAPNITGARTLTYWLDVAGNRTRTIWPDGYYVVRDYDDINRPTTVRENGTFVLATYVHDPLSRRTSLVYGNGTTQSYAWSLAGDLTGQTHTLSGTANTWTLGYSKAHQLVSEAASNAAWGHVASVDETTSYGAANNLNQYVSVTQGASPSVTLTHDANGNLTGEGTWTFAYDAENRLLTANRAGTAASYLYDPLGRRQAKVVNGVTTSFLSDGAEEVAEYTGAGALLRRYIPGPGTDQPIAMVSPAGGGHTRSYFHVNRQGSTVAMSNDAGVMAEGPYTYDAYGQGPTSAGVPFKYTGRRLDPETGLYYYRARYYSASLGRFLQTDPVGYADQMNLYGYVSNDPVNLTDPSGLRPGDRFRTPHEAAIDAVNWINPVSKRDNIEFGGTIEREIVIVRNSDGRPVINPDGSVKTETWYFATEPKPGSRDKVTVPYNPSTTVGWYHTHGEYSREEGRREVKTVKQRDQFDSDNFNDADRKAARGVAQVTSGARARYGERFCAYLGTPSGEVKSICFD